MSDIITSINTVSQVASYLGVSEETVRRLARTGKIKKIKLLGKTRITREALLEFINQ
jgi:DNA binding domain, excisionase family